MPNGKLPPCDCGFLEKESNIPDSPIVFDPDLNEYNFAFRTDAGQKAALRIYHCPFCGGRAPKSRRDKLFATLSHAEKHRLVELTKHLRTLDDVLREFGQPDNDHAASRGETTPEQEGKPETTRFYRRLIYTQLSQTADIHVTVHPTDRVATTFLGKYVGKNKA
jgi:hypothetical protein